MSILLLVEHDNQSLKEVNAHSFTAAKILAEKTGKEIILFIAGTNCHAVAEASAKMAGVKQVLLADNEALAHQLPENMAPLLAQVAKAHGVSHIMAAATTEGKSILPRSAALLDVGQISDIIDVIDGNTYVRPIYAGNALATVQSSDSIQVITVRAAAFDASDLSATDNSAPIVSIEDIEASGLAKFVGEELSVSDRPDLASARVVVSGGRGLQAKENFSLLESLADKLGAAVGASRAAVDAGYVPNDMQVGQTGKIIAPDIYLAVGISGAIQHLAGMKDSKTIIAINKDEDAPIFNVADYGLVGDLFDVLPELEAQLD